MRYAVVALTYLAAALAAGAAAALLLPGPHPLLVTFAADVVATLVVFAVSMVIRNASLYDPYWSVAPAVIVFAWVLGESGEIVRQTTVLLLVLIWSVRLTWNWASSWRGLDQEDWRYVRLRAQRPPFWLVNLVGIQLMPTVVVFAGLLAVWPAVAVPGRGFGVLDIVAVAVTAAAVAIEATAGRQLHRFAADPAHRGQIMASGLWRYSRHPNYLGEILFWWGMWLFGLAAAPGWWWTVVGPVTMVLLFTAVSIPMMDKRSLERRPAYEEHMRRVPALLPRRR
ncbi:DUF1295 domain-containing protein [Actinoplanes sp. NPDC023936]|uniref:DUF1295 domain-containing protein n=1 Tax=Actinoplanes sp. NPDC023936 TaxID=3154910 RepID=UPI0033F0EB7E